MGKTYLTWENKFILLPIKIEVDVAKKWNLQNKVPFPLPQSLSVFPVLNSLFLFWLFYLLTEQQRRMENGGVICCSAAPGLCFPALVWAPLHGTGMLQMNLAARIFLALFLFSPWGSQGHFSPFFSSSLISDQCFDGQRVSRLLPRPGQLQLVWLESPASDPALQHLCMCTDFPMYL